MSVIYDERIKQAQNEKMSFKTLVKGILISFLFTIPVFILFAVILTYASFPQKLISPVVIATTIVSIFAAGFISTGKLKDRGWLNGALTGFVYMLVLYFLSSIMFNNFSIDRYVITMTVIGILTGAIGGLLGCGKGSRGYKKVKHNVRHKYK